MAYRMDKKVPTCSLYSTGHFIQYPVISHNGKEYFKGLYITESLCYTGEINTTL